MSLSLCSFGGATGVEHQYDFEYVDDDEAEDSKIMKRTHGLPNLVDVVQTGPHGNLSQREQQIHDEEQHYGA